MVCIRVFILYAVLSDGRTLDIRDVVSGDVVRRRLVVEMVEMVEVVLECRRVDRTGARVRHRLDGDRAIAALLTWRNMLPVKAPRERLRGGAWWGV